MISDILDQLDDALNEMDCQAAAPSSIQSETNDIKVLMSNSSISNTSSSIATEDASSTTTPTTTTTTTTLLAEIQAAIDESNHVCCQVKKALDKGMVKPYFHKMALPETFLNHARSWKSVTAGDVDPIKSMELDHDGKNLDNIIVMVDDDNNKDGMTRGAAAAAAQSIFDNTLKHRWDFSADQTNFAVELVNTDAEMVGENVECTTLQSIPVKINPADNASLQLLTRPESRGIVSDIFHRFATKLDGGSVSAITGSPGIGKSWTLFYALQQALHYNGATMLFFFQKRKCAILYHRRNNKMYAWTSVCHGAACSSLFHRLDVLVLLDPDEARNGGAQFALGEVKLLLAASNDDDHFKNGADKFNKYLYAFLGPPLDEELLVILKRLDPRLKRRVIESRKKQVGNLFRYILDETYERRKAAIKKAVDECAGNEQLLQSVVWNEGMCAARETITEKLFVVFPNRPSQPTDTGYDGQHVDYYDRKVKAATEKVRTWILRANRKVVLSYC